MNFINTSVLKKHFVMSEGHKIQELGVEFHRSNSKEGGIFFLH